VYKRQWTAVPPDARSGSRSSCATASRPRPASWPRPPRTCGCSWSSP